jgi:hypothetical protein
VNGWRILLSNGVPLARSQGQEIELLDSRSGVSFTDIQRRLATVRALHREEAGGA